jgi:pimeloyl-ACP methyl ester carboxylesterase
MPVRYLPRAVSILIFLLLAACVSSQLPSSQRGSLVSVQNIKHFDRNTIDRSNHVLSLSGPAQCDVDVTQLIYHSVGVRHEPAVLSAGLYVPKNCPGPFPVLAEGHGTQADRKHLATDITAGNGSIAFFAAQGYVVVVTDYLGLGKSDYPYHPYLHADSEASAMVDSIRAARNALKTLEVPVSDRVMIYGYSQGGHAAMAAQREIERQHQTEIRLVASAPMSGPYHLSQTFLSSWFGATAGEENPLASELLSYTLTSYSKIYPAVCTDIKDCFAPSYSDIVATLFPSERSLFAIRETNLLPFGRQLSQLRNPAFTTAFLLDQQEPFREALSRNDLIDWTPVAPMILCGSSRDAMVDFNNAYAAQAAFRSRGVEVPVIDVANDIPAAASGLEHHARYAPPLCYAVAKKLFDSNKQAGPARL